MNSLKFFILAFIFTPIICYSQSASGGKIDRVRKIWSPVFESVIHENLPPNIKKEQILKTNELFYKAYSEFLTDEYISTQEEIFKTSVGKKIGQNLVRAMFGLQQVNLTYDNLSQSEKIEWEAFSREHYSEINRLNSKMNGFTGFLKVWIANNMAK